MDGPSGPLDGVRVVEIASFVSGPFATMMLADLGADVVKVEPPKGDPLRRFGRSGTPMSPLFANTNRGKRSVVLDLKDGGGRRALEGLLAEADVLVCNWRPAAGRRLGIDDARLAAANPRLVRVYVTGFGADGPQAGAPTFDAVVQARTGLTEALGGPDDPALAPMYLVDKLTAAFVCQATLAALVGRERTGTGDRVDLSLLEAAAYLNFPDVLVNRTFPEHSSADGPARNRQAAAVRPIAAADGWLVVAPVTAAQVRRACDAAGLTGLADELLALTDAVALTGQMLDALETVVRTEPVEHWLAAFAAADVPAGPCLTLDQHLADEQVAHRGLYDVAHWEGLGAVRRIRYPATFGRSGPLFGRGGPPALGEHTADVATGGAGG